MCDSAKIKAILEGDEDAFRQFVDDYKLMVVNICYGFIHDAAEAEDIAQDVFIQVYESLEKFRGDCKFSTWLYRIAVNRSINYRKSRLFRMKKVSLDICDCVDFLAEDGLPQQMIEKEELMELLHHAVNSLPERQKTALVLNKYDELSYKEVAEVMGISVSSVESLLFRAKSRLEQVFGNYKK